MYYFINIYDLISGEMKIKIVKAWSHTKITLVFKKNPFTVNFPGQLAEGVS